MNGRGRQKVQPLCKGNNWPLCSLQNYLIKEGKTNSFLVVFAILIEMTLDLIRQDLHQIPEIAWKNLKPKPTS